MSIGALTTSPTPSTTWNFFSSLRDRVYTYIVKKIWGKEIDLALKNTIIAGTLETKVSAIFDKLCQNCFCSWLFQNTKRKLIVTIVQFSHESLTERLKNSFQTGNRREVEAVLDRLIFSTDLPPVDDDALSIILDTDAHAEEPGMICPSGDAIPGFSRHQSLK